MTERGASAEIARQSKDIGGEADREPRRGVLRVDGTAMGRGPHRRRRKARRNVPFLTSGSSNSCYTADAEPVLPVTLLHGCTRA